MARATLTRVTLTRKRGYLGRFSRHSGLFCVKRTDDGDQSEQKIGNFRVHRFLVEMKYYDAPNNTWCLLSQL